MTTDADRQHGEQVRARLAAATPGPWCVVDDEDWEEVRVIKGAVNRRATPSVCTPICTTDQDGTDDAELIAHAPNDLARLLSRAEKAEQERDDEAHDHALLRDRMSALLTGVADALNGRAERDALTMWSWHDLPEKAHAVVRALAFPALTDTIAASEKTSEAGR